ncbi:MinD/ParA family ATP-binding protein [Microbacterium sp. GCS4]|uniref:MinD/ParA family ATP-binding protein n=1 Tax=Microbacterium sp. GCS4 TaxID=1692239 RepID=UPI000681C091|nr:AAA family ATPase [Microbacterium sp. GCS4]
MTRDGEAYGGGPLRRGNTSPPETPELVEHVPLTPQDQDDDDWPTMPGYAVSRTPTAAPTDHPPTPPAPAAPVTPGAPTTPPTSATAPAVTPAPRTVPAPTTRAAAAAAAANRPAAPSEVTAPAPAPAQASPQTQTSPPDPATTPSPSTASIPSAPATPPVPTAMPVPPQAADQGTAPAARPTMPPASGAPSSPAATAAPPQPTSPAQPELVEKVPGAHPPRTSAPSAPFAPAASHAPATPHAPAAPHTPAAQHPPAASQAPTAPHAPAAPQTPAAPHAPAAPQAPAASASDHPAASRREQREQGVERRSFLQQDPREDPARRGGRGFLNRLGFSLGPNASERAQRDDEHAVSRHWPGPRTVAVVNGKGGAGKTPATVLLSAVFAQYGGAGVLAWDNNQTRGTLGWRTETGAHDRTLLELLPQTQRLLGAQGQSADLAHFVHHQPQEKYDVLRSKPIRLAHENRLSPADVDAIHAVAAKFYRLIIIDSGNDESDPMWLRMIDRADQLVVATTTRDDHAEAGALLLEALEDRDERSAHLARQAVVVVSQADPKASSAEIAEVVAGYQPLAREVVQIPYDREMVDGHLRLRALASPTQEAWLSAAAAVARGF